MSWPDDDHAQPAGPRPEVGYLLVVKDPDGRVQYGIVTAVHDDDPDGWVDVEAVPDPFGPQWPDANRPGRAAPS